MFWNVGEDRSIRFWDTAGRKSIITMYKIKKKIGKIYSPFGKFADRAKSWK